MSRHSQQVGIEDRPYFHIQNVANGLRGETALARGSNNVFLQVLRAAIQKEICEGHP
jgi:hypothetical protein